MKYRKLTELKKLPNNPRLIKDDQFKILCQSIESNKDYFEARPILLSNRTGELIIIGGNQRYAAAKHLKLKEVPTYLIEDLTEERERELIIRDNVSNGNWDMDLLANNFEIPDLENWGLDLDWGIVEEEAEIVEDEAPEVKEESIVKKGDVWLLGNHRLKCGDSTLIDDVEDLMDGEKADMVFTDPPYNINFKPPRGTHDIIKNDNMSDDDFEKFLSDVFVVCKAVLKKDTYLISFMGWSTIPSFKKALEELFKIKSMPIWVKNNFGIGYYTRPKYEPFYLCLNGEPKKPLQPPADVFEFAKVHKTIHSCEKPIGLIVDIIKHFVDKGMLYDPFGGSGSTLIACEQTNRKCFMMELDEHYSTVILERYLNFKKNNGDDVYLLKDGKKIPYKEVVNAN